MARSEIKIVQHLEFHIWVQIVLVWKIWIYQKNQNKNKFQVSKCVNEIVNLRGILSFSIFDPKHIQNETNLILVFSWQSSALVKKRSSSINFIYGCSPLFLLRPYANHQNGFKCKVFSKAKWLFLNCLLVRFCFTIDGTCASMFDILKWSKNFDVN